MIDEVLIMKKLIAILSRCASWARVLLLKNGCNAEVDKRVDLLSCRANDIGRCAVLNSSDLALVWVKANIGKREGGWGASVITCIYHTYWQVNQKKNQKHEEKVNKLLVIWAYSGSKSTLRIIEFFDFFPESPLTDTANLANIGDPTWTWKLVYLLIISFWIWGQLYILVISGTKPLHQHSFVFQENNVFGPLSVSLWVIQRINIQRLVALKSLEVGQDREYFRPCWIS